MQLTTNALTELVARVLCANGMSAQNAGILAAVIVTAERDNARSHGLFRVPGYINTLNSGWVDGTSVPEVIDAAPGVVKVDAKNGFAQIASAAGRPILIEKARCNGIAALAIRNSHHFAALWADIEPLAEAGLVAFAFVNGRCRLAPWGAGKRLLGTNPMAFACPRPNDLPLVWDQASSVIALGEVMLAAKEGKSIELNIGVDSRGLPTTDAKAIVEGAMLPFAGHKGSGIATMVEIMAAALTGAPFGFEDQSAKVRGAETTKAGETIVAMDPHRFAGAEFAERIQQFLLHLASGGVGRLPGDRRHAARRKAEREGISVDQETYDNLLAFLTPSESKGR